MTMGEICEKHLSFVETRRKNQNEIPCTVVVRKVEHGIPVELYKNTLSSIDEIARHVPEQYQDIDIRYWFLKRNPLCYVIVIEPGYVSPDISELKFPE